MFLLDWFWDFLTYLGLYKSYKLVIIGLDNAGKSTLMSLLRYGKLIQHPPTARPVSQEMTLFGNTFKAFDLGGHVMARRLWMDYFPVVDGIVFVVDAADHSRMGEAKVEINGVLDCDIVSDVPVLVLGNKMDKSGSIGKEMLIDQLGVYSRLTDTADIQDDNTRAGQKRKCEIFMTSLVYRQGYGDAFRWLAKQIKSRRNS